MVWVREYWMTSRGPGFLVVVWFGSPHPSPVSKFSLNVCRRSSLLRSQIIRRRASLVPLWIIQYSLAGALPVKKEESLARSFVPLVQVVNQRQLRQLDVVPAERKIKIQVFSWVSDPDPDWIRISIRSVYPYPDSDSESGWGYRRAEKTHKIKLRNLMLDALFWGLRASSVAWKSFMEA